MTNLQSENKIKFLAQENDGQILQVLFVLVSVIYFKTFQHLQCDITCVFLKLSQNPGTNQESAVKGLAASTTSESSLR